MELTEFYDKIENHNDLRGIAINTEDKQLAVEHIPSKLATMIPSEAVRESTWQTLEEILVGKREPQVLYHMTRVVGYYSRVENWNQSKVGELKDRRAGNYGLNAKPETVNA